MRLHLIGQDDPRLRDDLLQVLVVPTRIDPVHVRPPLRLHRKPLDPRRLPDALRAGQHQHVVHLAPRVEHTRHGGHEHDLRDHPCVVRVLLHRQRLMQPWHSVPPQRLQVLPHLMPRSAAGKLLEHVSHVVLRRLQAILPAQVNPGGHVVNVNQITVLDPGAAEEFRPMHITEELIVPEDQLKVARRVLHVPVLPNQQLTPPVRVPVLHFEIVVDPLPYTVIESQEVQHRLVRREPVDRGVRLRLPVKLRELVDTHQVESAARLAVRRVRRVVRVPQVLVPRHRPHSGLTVRRLVPPPVTDLLVRQVEELDQFVQVLVGVVELPDNALRVQRLLPSARVWDTHLGEPLRGVHGVGERVVHIERIALDLTTLEPGPELGRRAEHELRRGERRHVNDVLTDPRSDQELLGDGPILLRRHRAGQSDNRAVLEPFVC